MNRNELFKQIITAFVSGHTDTAAELTRKIKDEDSQAYFGYVTTLFAAGVDHWFTGERDAAAARSFVNDMRQEFDEGVVNFLVVEGLIRALFGEDELLDDISAQEQMDASLAVIRKIFDQSQEIRDRLDDYLSDAAVMADELAGSQ
ncbi:MAG TPA: hypothetical protein H9902_11390 [Candidatus Stackebrandtia faecavium]|nr:hypothetical protein [Candidatus Stackebrandtia faecavium]